MLRSLAVLLLLCTSAITAPVPQARPDPPFPYGVHRVEGMGTLTLTRHGTFARCFPWGTDSVGTFERTPDGIRVHRTLIRYTWEDGMIDEHDDSDVEYTLIYDRRVKLWKLDNSYLSPLD